MSYLIISSLPEIANKKGKKPNLRSIRIKSILQAQQLRLGEGYPLTKTSSNFVFATNHLKENHVYLQRGFKSYGLTHPNTFNKLHIFDEKNLDYHMHKKRFYFMIFFIGFVLFVYSKVVHV